MDRRANTLPITLDFCRVTVADVNGGVKGFFSQAVLTVVLIHDILLSG
jgi:hypothetical protein